jgi:hypothetical protein
MPFRVIFLLLYMLSMLPVYAQRGVVTIEYSPGKPINTFLPLQTFGAGVDGQQAGDIEKMLTPFNVSQMQKAGFLPLSYRLRTELGGEAWHWNPQGLWSDPSHHQGYWVSDSHPGDSINLCYGYRLPRRGNTIDQANHDGYSRIDDGDPSSFWKSNPYLDQHYTGEVNSRHPQWILVDLGKKRPVNAMRLLWGNPWAVQYRISFWTGDENLMQDDHPDGDWRLFPGGEIRNGSGGSVFIRFLSHPIHARFVKIEMLRSSHTAPVGSMDIRDRLGYAIKEIYLGYKDGHSHFNDFIRHGKSIHSQSCIYTSSTDPWHRAIDIDRNIEQPGFDLIYRLGLTNHQSMMVPVPVLYDNPDNAVAELKWLQNRGYSFGPIEMGEEPDGQYAAPEDYAALYIQFAMAIKKKFPNLPLGGPCFQSSVTDITCWLDKAGDHSWMKRFLKYLKKRDDTKLFNFFSFEWYPFDDTRVNTAPQLKENTSLLTHIITRLEEEGLPHSIPWYITEYGYSSSSGRPEVDIEGALLNADIVGKFLSLGGQRAYLYGYEPNSLIEEMPGAWGNNMILQADDTGKAKYRTAAFWGAWLVTHVWAPVSLKQGSLYMASCSLRNNSNYALVSVYPLRYANGMWSVMLINKDPLHAYTLKIRIHNTLTGKVTESKGSTIAWRYSGKQYVWKSNGVNGHPLKSLPPVRKKIQDITSFPMPPYSMAILQWKNN